MGVYNTIKCPKCQSRNWEKCGCSRDGYECKDCGNKFQFKQDEEAGKPPSCPYDCPHGHKIEALMKFMESQKE